MKTLFLYVRHLPLSTIFIFLGASTLTFAEPVQLNFPQIWSKIRQESPALKEAAAELEESQFEANRAKFHWFPSVGLQGKLFSTNDPAMNFVSNLNQRQISAFDFNPNSLNKPGSHIFSQVTLGIDLPLYEGGMKRSAAKAYEFYSEAASFSKSSVVVKEYTETARSFLMLQVLYKTQTEIQNILETTQNILARYSLGSESNPVGYSGKLGLQSVQLRAESVKNEIELDSNRHRISLAEKAKLNLNEWQIIRQEYFDSLERYLPEPKDSQISFQEKAALSQARASDYLKSAEWARYLPKIGLFANQNLNHGARDLATSYAAGVYLQWSLFDSQSLDRLDQKSAAQRKARARSDFAGETSTIYRTQLKESETTLRKNYALLVEGEKLLNEQVKTAAKLFRSGSISALQLAEVLNRRIDLALNLKSLQNQWVEVRQQQWTLTQPQGIE